MVYDTQQSRERPRPMMGIIRSTKKKGKKKEKELFSVEVPKCGDDQNRKGKTVEDNKRNNPKNFKLLLIFMYLESHSTIDTTNNKKKKYLRKQNQKGKCLYTPPDLRGSAHIQVGEGFLGSL